MIEDYPKESEKNARLRFARELRRHPHFEMTVVARPAENIDANWIPLPPNWRANGNAARLVPYLGLEHSSDGQCFLVRPYLRWGTSLEDWLRKNPSSDERADVLAVLQERLAELWESGNAHGNLKASNVFVGHEGGRRDVWLVDWDPAPMSSLGPSRTEIDREALRRIGSDLLPPRPRFRRLLRLLKDNRRDIQRLSQLEQERRRDNTSLRDELASLQRGDEQREKLGPILQLVAGLVAVGASSFARKRIRFLRTLLIISALLGLVFPCVTWALIRHYRSLIARPVGMTCSLPVSDATSGYTIPAFLRTSDVGTIHKTTDVQGAEASCTRSEQDVIDLKFVH